MSGRSGLAWIFAISPLFIVSSPPDAVADAFTSRSQHWLGSLSLPSGARYACGKGCLFSSATDRDVGDTSCLPDEVYKQLEYRHPHVAEQITRPDAFVRSTEEWLVRYLGLSESEQKRMYSRWPVCPKRIRRLGRHRLHEWFAFFLAQGLDHDQLRKMIVSRPQLLSYKLSNVQSTTAFFREDIALSSKEFASLLKAYPSVLMYSIDKRLRPTVDFLQNECGGGKDNWASWKRVIYSYPTIFSHSLDGRLLPKIEFFCNETGGKSLGLKRSELSQVVAKFPPALWLSEENLQSKIDFLTESLDLKRSELIQLLVSYPQILGLSLDNLRRKLIFFLDANEGDHNSPSLLLPGDAHRRESHDPITCDLSRDQLKEFVLYQPALLAYSLEKRLKPRIQRMQEKNIFFHYCPKNLMSYTDEKFDDWLSTQVSTWSVSE